MCGITMTKLRVYDILIEMNGKKVGDRIYARSKRDVESLVKNPAYKLFGFKVLKIKWVKGMDAPSSM